MLIDPPVQRSLAGRVALVTGASRGIGRATARALAHRGAHLALVARTRTALARLAEEISAGGVRALPIAADLADTEATRQAVVTCVEAFGRLDVLVHAAGVGVFKPLAETSVAEWDQVMAVNARAAFVLACEALPHLARNGGCIVNVGSVVAVKGYVHQGAYTASKHALLGMTKVLAQEAQALGVRAYAVCPGGVDTDMAARARPDLDREALMAPEEVADAVLYLVLQRGRAVVDQLNLRRASGTPWFD